MNTPQRMAVIAAEERQRHGWTVQQLAGEAGVPVSVVASIESGQPVAVDVDQVHRVFRVLQVKILALPSSLAMGTP